MMFQPQKKDQVKFKIKLKKNKQTKKQNKTKQIKKWLLYKE